MVGGKQRITVAIFRIFVGAGVVRPFADRLHGVAGTEHVYYEAADAYAALDKARGAGLTAPAGSIKPWPSMPVAGEAP